MLTTAVILRFKQSSRTFKWRQNFLSTTPKIPTRLYTTKSQKTQTFSFQTIPISPTQSTIKLFPLYLTNTTMFAFI